MSTIRPTSPMYSNIIFDLDGTLIESLPGIASALNAALTESKLPTHSTQAVRNFIGDGSYTLCQRAIENPSPDLVESVHQAFLKHYASDWQKGTHVFEGIHALIEELLSMDCTLSILSNKVHSFTLDIVKHLFPDAPFKLVLGQRDGIAKKPDPSGIHEILGELDQSSSKSILVGDSTVDIITARNAGIHSLAVTWGYHDLPELQAVAPTHTAHTVQQILDILTPTHTPALRQPA